MLFLRSAPPHTCIPPSPLLATLLFNFLTPPACPPLPRARHFLAPPPPLPPLPQDFDPATRKASILYTTGEAEELSLEEVIKDGHMSLIHIHR